MKNKPVKRLLVMLACAVLAASGAADQEKPGGEADPSAQATPIRRALAYLADEVPRWSRENACFSCHNNGDGARTLYIAMRLSHPVAPEALSETTSWLAQPRRWDHNEGEGGYDDKTLARIQFGASLVEAIDAGALRAEGALIAAAELIAETQEEDGSWRIDAEGNIGSPATYGSVLGTTLARRTLARAEAQKFSTPIARAQGSKFAGAIARATGWLLDRRPKTVLDSASLLIALAEGPAGQNEELRAQCLEIITKGQTSDGGWGPYLNVPPEPFDTALVILALLPSAGEPEIGSMIRRGRDFLIAMQYGDGGWPGTTRPPGAASYAQHISTTGWAAQALLLSEDEFGGR